MSLILDALRKSDRQRARNAAERLRDGPGVAPKPGMQRFALPAITGLLLLVLLGLLLRELNETRGTASGEALEIMENEPAAAAVRDLAGELAVPREVAARPVPDVDLARDAGGTAAVAVDTDALAAPPLETLPELRMRLPALQLDIHAWAEDPAARFVLINLRRYQEGERLQEGPLVRQIRPEGVVLEHEGTLFSLPRR